jgi:purine-binding chemotaxis protein CheW
MDTVREIVPTVRAARIPGAPPAVRGLVNVRGMLLPVVDGGILLTNDTTAGAGGTVLLDVGDTVIGIAVDAVEDLVFVDPDQLTDRESLAGVDPDVVRAVGRHGGEPFVLLDVDALLGPLLPA